MDATDRRILKRLQENSRVTVSVLSQEFPYPCRLLVKD